jgi:hypothetical protein
MKIVRPLKIIAFYSLREVAAAQREVTKSREMDLQT